MEVKKVFSLDEAKAVGEKIGVDWRKYSLEQFRAGMNVELEHGLADEDTNVTNDNPVVTGKIALAHLKEFPDYYIRLEQMEEAAKEGRVSTEHYYGDLVRKLFMIGGVVMVVGLPFIGSFITLPIFASILGILLLGVLAGLTSPVRRWVTVINLIVSVLAFVTFEGYAIKFFYDRQTFFFVINEGLSLLFLAAIYYSTKTWRGMQK